jgi:alanine dehydrogenase
MGADAEGKHELDDAILLDSKLVIDDHAQCTHSGEINVPYAAGTLGDEDIHAELGAVVIGEASGRTDDGITVFDSTGLAIQDVASAHVVYEYAREHGVGESMELVGTDL